MERERENLNNTHLSVRVRKVMETMRLHSQLTVVAIAMAVLRAHVG